jgi:hypothetical protein
MEYTPIVDGKREIPTPGDEKSEASEFPRPAVVRRRSRLVQTLEGILSSAGSILLWSAPGLGLNVGQSEF